jgi:hypothetical protein
MKVFIESLRAVLPRLATLTLKVWHVALVAVVIVIVFFSFSRHRHAGEEVELTVSPENLGVDKLAEKVRADLETLAVTTSGQQPLFKLKNFDLEITFVAKRSGKNKAEITPEVVTVGSEEEQNREGTHKVTLHFEVLPLQQIVVMPTAHAINVPPDVVRLPDTGR